jgi:hypothetical protein
MRTFQVVTVTFLALTLGHQAAADRWDADPNDGNDLTHAFIAPGQAQNGRDLESPQGTPPDQDWVQMSLEGRHSYEARAIGAAVWLPQSNGAKLERLDSSGAVVQSGTFLGNFAGQTMRWVTNSVAFNYLRVTGPPNTSQGTAPYTLELFDTTYVVPRFNNSATQTTILIIHNNTGTAVTAFLYYYGAPGNLLDTEPVVIEPRATVVLNTSTIGPLAGQSGAVNVAKSGGRDALSGKAVAVEPSNGFTFDTPMTPVLP